MKTTLLIPTLNEIDGMRAIMPQIQRDWVDQILIVDGGSTDGTVEYAKEHGYEIYMQKEPGVRQAYMTVLPYIQGDVLITFSPDGNSIPQLIPRLVAKMKEGYDMVIASRYLGPARSADDDWLTAFGNWLFTRTVNLLHGGHYTDVMVILLRLSYATDPRLGAGPGQVAPDPGAALRLPHQLGALAFGPRRQAQAEGGGDPRRRAAPHRRAAEALRLAVGGRLLLPVPPRGFRLAVDG